MCKQNVGTECRRNLRESSISTAVVANALWCISTTARWVVDEGSSSHMIFEYINEVGVDLQESQGVDTGCLVCNNSPAIPLSFPGMESHASEWSLKHQEVK